MPETRYVIAREPTGRLPFGRLLLVDIARRGIDRVACLFVVIGEFPLLHAAALDRPGSEKGGPYSEGTFPGGGQYGRLVVTDDGGGFIVVELSGHTFDGAELVSLELQIAVPPDVDG